MAKKLTRKQSLFVRGIAEGKTQTKAALDAYDIEGKDPERIASALAVENLGKPSIQQAVELARIKLNITPERALKPIDDALNADDIETRLKGSDRALKIMQALEPKDKGGTTIIFNKGDVVKSKYVKD